MIDKDTIPKHWKIKNLEDVCRKISLNNIKIKQKDYLPQGSFPIVDQGSELIGGYSNETKFIVPEDPPYVIFGDHTKVKKYINFKFIAGADGVKVLKPLSELDPKFLFYCLQIIKIPDKGYARHFHFLEKENIPIPPITEQYQIVAEIEELLSELDKGNQQLEMVKQQLETYRQAVLKWAFAGKFTNKDVIDGQLPKGWKLVKLGEICKKVLAVKRKEKDQNEEFIYLDIGGIDNKTNKIVNHKNYRWENAPSRAQQIVFSDDILFSTVRTYLKNIALINKKEYDGQIASSGFCVIRGNQEVVNKKYVFYFSISQVFLDPLSELQTGSSYPAVRDKDVFSQIIPLPSLIEQNLIVIEIETRLSVCDKMEETIENCLQQSESLRQSILKQAFEGKLIKPDANYG